MVKNAAQRIVFPILDADGDPVTGAASDTPDSEYSLDGGSFSDCNDEIHEIATNSGVYYLDLQAGETNGDVVCIQIKTATATTKTTVLVFYTSAQSLDTVDGVVDGIQTDLSNGTDGLGALKSLIDTVDTVVDGIQDDLDNETDGLGALKALIDTLDTVADGIQTDLNNETDGLGALKALIDAIQSTANTIEGYTDKIDDATNGLTAIKAEVEGLGGEAMRGTDSAALAASWTADLATILANFTAARIGYIDELAAANLPTDVTAVINDLANGTDGLGALKALIDALQVTITKLDDTLEDDGGTYRFTENALEEAPTGEGGGGDATAENQELLIKILTGKWEVTGNQLIMYDTDGETALYTFDLTQDGVPTEYNPDKREPV